MRDARMSDGVRVVAEVVSSVDDLLQQRSATDGRAPACCKTSGDVVVAYSRIPIANEVLQHETGADGGRQAADCGCRPLFPLALHRVGEVGLPVGEKAPEAVVVGRDLGDDDVPLLERRLTRRQLGSDELPLLLLRPRPEKRDLVDLAVLEVVGRLPLARSRSGWAIRRGRRGRRGADGVTSRIGRGRGGKRDAKERGCCFVPWCSS